MKLVSHWSTTAAGFVFMAFILLEGSHQLAYQCTVLVSQGQINLAAISIGS